MEISSKISFQRTILILYRGCFSCFHQSISDSKNRITTLKIENKQKKKTNWKYFKFVKTLSSWNFQNCFVCVCMCVCVCVCVCLYVCVCVWGINNFSKVSSNSYKIFTVNIILRKKLHIYQMLTNYTSTCIMPFPI